jgi:hypothetical protein
MLLSSTHVHTRANSGANNVVPDSGANFFSDTRTNSFSNTCTNTNANASANGANNNCNNHHNHIHNDNNRFRSDVIYDNVASFIAGSTDHEHTVDVDHSAHGATFRVFDVAANNDDINNRDSGECIECNRKQCANACVVKRFRRFVDR